MVYTLTVPNRCKFARGESDQNHAAWSERIAHAHFIVALNQRGWSDPKSIRALRPGTLAGNAEAR
jgi:hypothetical protein